MLHRFLNIYLVINIAYGVNVYIYILPGQLVTLWINETITQWRRDDPKWSAELT